ncbi:hypothetical protein [Pseudobacteriovorax antillogorgiicola]|uniref:Lipoprotein n=1 Tax=Pseudobacteriovorax antillogorgiicola TaxID=1513793 RepID=A0A1Y6BJJ7_9BACT|nr:hypothetical protein [Pseudobacteriovorax antillogorgiicola]TCS55303.1 hypothetical protein EDD56_10524 [Pseudobacteriovorax antillogorgiicola]SMF14441.1 hypothetical protein SAMN06296036_105300 [Pseudobacteriovorax antillogorgiicola]
MRLGITILWITLTSCRTLHADDDSAKKGSLNLVRVVGEKSSATPPPSENMCSIQLADNKEAEGWFQEAIQSDMSTAMVFRPFRPSLKYSASLRGKSVILLHAADTLKSRDGDSALALIKLLDDQCPPVDGKQINAPITPQVGNKKTKK